MSGRWGEISHRGGATTASRGSLEITVSGKQGHGTTPWNAVDPIMTSALAITGLQTVVSRKAKLTELPLVVTIGPINGDGPHRRAPAGPDGGHRPEQRRQERWSLERVALVWPLADGAPAEAALPGSIRDISLKGMRLRMPSPPGAEEILILLESPQGGEPIDLIGRVANVTPCADGDLDVGVQFPGPVSAVRPVLPATVAP
jgi:hypothetical protein